MAAADTSPFCIARIPDQRMSGRSLRMIASLARTGPGAALVKRMFSSQLGIDALSRLPESDRAPVPFEARPLPGRPPRQLAGAARPYAPPTGMWPRTSRNFTERYRAGTLTPRAVAEAALSQARALAGSGRLGGGPIYEYDESIRRDADAATARWAAGQPLGPLDGVPVAVKEEMEVAGMRARAGTSFLGQNAAAQDSYCVARLRAAGALILGTTPMTEYGMTTFGHNAQRAMPRNPHNPAYGGGGSSTGSGVAVAVGLVPVAAGADGGGSIRIPSSSCGVFGIKPSFGRISRTGDIFGGTMDHLGPIASNVEDLASFLDVCSGIDPLDTATLYPPAPAAPFATALDRGVRGLRIGLVEELWSEASQPIADAGRAALAALERAGATLTRTRIPLADASTSIGYLSIALEMYADLRFARIERPEALGADMTVSLSALSGFDSGDYLDAQRLRGRLREQVAAAYREVDLIALPTTCRTAPAMTDVELRGLMCAAHLHAHCRTNMLGNLCGLPAASAPVGRDTNNLPMGLMLMGDAWDEHTVLAALAELERSGAATVQRPQVTVDLP